MWSDSYFGGFIVYQTPHNRFIIYLYGISISGEVACQVEGNWSTDIDYLGIRISLKKLNR